MHSTSARTILSLEATPSQFESQKVNRHKRTMVFRPMFVYKQQQNNRLKEEEAERRHDQHTYAFGEPSQRHPHSNKQSQPRPFQ